MQQESELMGTKSKNIKPTQKDGHTRASETSHFLILTAEHLRDNRGSWQNTPLGRGPLMLLSPPKPQLLDYSFP